MRLNREDMQKRNDEIERLLKEGHTTLEIAKLFNISRDRVNHILRDRGIYGKPPSKKNMGKVKEIVQKRYEKAKVIQKEAIQMAMNGYTLGQIGCKYRVSRQYISMLLIKNGMSKEQINQNINKTKSKS